MARRIITILLILLAVLALVVGASWLVARKTAQKNGTAVPTFREFIGLGSKPASVIPNRDSISADFTGDNSKSDQPKKTSTDSVNVSQFTGTTLSPAAGAPVSSPTGTPTPSSTATPPPTPVGTAPSSGGGTPTCSDEDLTITFTPQEIARLNALQKRFYAIAPTLRSDGDVAAEFDNYDIFKAKASNVTELYNYCQSKVASVQSPAWQWGSNYATGVNGQGTDRTDYNTTGYLSPRNTLYTFLQNRVPTPFWRGGSSVIDTFSANFNGAPGYQGTVNLSDIHSGVHNLERILRLSLW